jgi:hypothetical protein
MIMVIIYFRIKQFQETLFPIYLKTETPELKVKEDKLTLKETVELKLCKKALSIRQDQTTKIINPKSHT